MKDMNKSKTCDDCKYLCEEKGKINSTCLSCRNAYFETHEGVDRKAIMFKRKEMEKE